MRFPFALASCAGAVLVLVGCGGRAYEPSDLPIDTSGEPAGDAAPPDGTPIQDASIVDGSVADTSVADVSPPPDSGPWEFCSGASKLENDGVLVDPAVVTSSLLVMDCCDGFTLRFHTRDQIGVDLSVIVQYFGQLASGDYVFPVDSGELGLSVQNADEPGSWESNVSGTMRIEVPASYDEPTRASLCVQVQSPGQPLHGVRLFASNITVASWGWQNRFEVRLLADSNVTALQAAQLPLDSLQLASGDPTIHLLSLAWYEGSTHTGYWDLWYGGTYIINQLPPVGVHGLPFVVLADGQRVYLGAFMTTLSSAAVNMPVIVLESITEESFRIDPGYPGGPPPGQDPRSDPRILELLDSAGKLTP